MTQIVPNECKVALLAGGTSGERSISLASGQGAAEALEEYGFNVEMLDPACKEDLVKLAQGSYDVAFICLHGKGGEDGTIQGMLELLGIPYTGSGVLASALALDKAKAKLVYREAGIPTPPSLTVKASEREKISAQLETVSVPCVVKPATEGSALGVIIVTDPEKLQDAVDEALSIDTAALVECYINGTEVTVAVLGNNDAQALPIIEIVPINEFYDFESKYAPGGSKHICPAPLEEDLAASIRAFAEQAHKALGCRGMSRSDFIIDGEGQPWILETNTIPGMTATSLLPDAGRAAGLSFPELCARLIDLALE